MRSTSSKGVHDCESLNNKLYCRGCSNIITSDLVLIDKNKKMCFCCNDCANMYSIFFAFTNGPVIFNVESMDYDDVVNLIRKEGGNG